MTQQTSIHAMPSLRRQTKPLRRRLTSLMPALLGLLAISLGACGGNSGPGQALVPAGSTPRLGVINPDQDLNANGRVDSQDIAAGSSLDVNSNGVPDEVEADCDANGVPDGRVNQGTVWLDADYDGELDFEERGVGGVTVEARNCEGVLVGSTTTASDGTWSLPGIATFYGLQIRFSDYPGGHVDGFRGTDNDGPVQVVRGSDCEMNFALQVVGDCYARDPMQAFAITPCYAKGDPTGVTETSVATIHYLWTGRPAAYGGTAPNPMPNATLAQTGTVWGLAFDHPNRRLFAGALLRRGAGLGAAGIGAVYEWDYSSGTPTAPAGSFNLHGTTADNGGTINLDDPANPLTRVTGTANAGNDNFLAGAANNHQSRDNDAFNRVGTTGYGDLDITTDGQFLWLVNLYQRSLIQVDLSDPTQLPGSGAAVNHYALSALPGVPAANNGIMRPWALKFHAGQGYLGVVADASVSQDPVDLCAHVLRFDPNNIAAGFTTVLSFSLNYTREASVSGGPTGFQAWVTSPAQFSTYAENGGSGSGQYPQPVLSDIELTDTGDLILAFLDRAAFQQMQNDYTPFPASTNLHGYHAPSGEIVRACRRPDGTYALEGSADCLIATDGGNPPSGSGGVTTDGPNGGGEFFWYDHELNHAEATLGGCRSSPPTTLC